MSVCPAYGMPMARKMNLSGTGDRIARALVDGAVSGDVEWSASGHTTPGQARCRILADASLEVLPAEGSLRLVLQGPAVAELARLVPTDVVDVRGVAATMPSAGAFAAN